MKKRVSPGARRAIILIHARSISRLETAFGRCDLVELCNLFFHSSAGGDAGRPTQVRSGLWRWLLAPKKGWYFDALKQPILANRGGPLAMTGKVEH